jgi:hypothetical protein
MIDYLLLFITTVLQNASFTLVSRARNSKSILFHGLAAVFSNGIWLLVIRQVVTHLNSTGLMLTYLVASVIGSVLMHHISMNYIERKLK